MEWKERFYQLTRERFDRSPDQCGDRQLYLALMLLARELSANQYPPGSRHPGLRTGDPAGDGP